MQGVEGGGCEEQEQEYDVFCLHIKAVLGVGLFADEVYLVDAEGAAGCAFEVGAAFAGSEDDGEVVLAVVQLVGVYGLAGAVVEGDVERGPVVGGQGFVFGYLGDGDDLGVVFGQDVGGVEYGASGGALVQDGVDVEAVGASGHGPELVGSRFVEDVEGGAGGVFVPAGEADGHAVEGQAELCGGECVAEGVGDVERAEEEVAGGDGHVDACGQ